MISIYKKLYTTNIEFEYTRQQKVKLTIYLSLLH